jgi:ABC-type Na+ efflux pump permease subunit
MMMLRNFILEKKLGVLEAILATGVDKSSLALSRTASIFAVSTVQTFLTLLFFEMLARKNLGASLLDFYGSPDGILLSVNLLLLAAAWIWALVALLLIYSAVANYLLLLAFGLMFLYAGFYHILKAANAWLCCVFFAAMIAASMISAARFLRNAPNDRVIAE